MDLDTFIVTVFTRLDDAITALWGDRPLRAHGPRPTLTDSEVLTIEVVGAFLGRSEETDLFAYFRRHYTHFFPGLRSVHRTTFVRQAANLWKLKEQLWQWLLEEAPPPAYVIADSFPMAVCRFARAPRCQRFAGEAAFGWNWVDDHVFYGFRLHALLDPSGFIQCFTLAPANADEKEVLEQMTEGQAGRVLGDRNFWSPDWTQQMRERGIQVIAPFKRKTSDPQPGWSRFLSHLRYRIETVFGQFTERFEVKRVRAKDTWHLCNRLLRCVLSHTLALTIYRSLGGTDLKLAQLLHA